MTEDDPRIARREIADTLMRALERRHELLDVVVKAEDYDAAIEAIASHLGTSSVAAEAVLRLSFDRLTKVARRRIAAELEDLNNQLSFTMGEPASSVDSMVLRPFAADADRDIFAARTADVQEAGDGSRAPAGDLEDEIRAGLRRVHAEEAAWLVAVHGSQKIGMVFGDLAPARSMFGSGFTPTTASRATALLRFASHARRWPLTSRRFRWWCGHRQQGHSASRSRRITYCRSPLALCLQNVDFVRAYLKLGSRIRNICLNGNFSITSFGAADGRGGHRDPREHHGVHPQTQRT